MSKRFRLLLIGFAVAGSFVLSGASYGNPKDNPHGGGGKNPHADKSQNPHDEKSEAGGAHGKNAKSPKGNKGHTHLSGKEMVGDKIKTNGKHNIRQNGKFSESVTVQNGKIAGMQVTHDEKGNVPVTKYKTTKKMAERGRNGIYLASLYPAQDQYLGSTYIGYSYIDDDGNEVIEWFPYDMILDGDTGAIEYYEIPE